MFDENGFSKPLRLCYFDIPGITDQSDLSDDFFNVIADTEDLSIYEKFSVQVILEKAWSETRSVFIWFLALPYFILLVAFFAWSNFAAVDIESSPFESTETKNYFGKCCCMVIFFFCIFILA
jgi:hypothetical protein